jgi:hypothetical protein
MNKERSDRFTIPFARTCQFGDNFYHATLSPPTPDTSGPPDYEQSLRTSSTDETLDIGYICPNTFICNKHNSPQSPYWAMKAFVVLALQDDEEFWRRPGLAATTALVVFAIAKGA